MSSLPLLGLLWALWACSESIPEISLHTFTRRTIFPLGVLRLPIEASCFWMTAYSGLAIHSSPRSKCSGRKNQCRSILDANSSSCSSCSTR